MPLPDIRDQLKRKELQEKIAQMEAEEESKRVKIKRSDKEAFTKVSTGYADFALSTTDHLTRHSFLINNTNSSWNLNPLPMPMIPSLRKRLTVQ